MGSYLFCWLFFLKLVWLTLPVCVSAGVLFIFFEKRVSACSVLDRTPEWSECILLMEKRFIWVEDATRMEEPWGSGEIWNRTPSLHFSLFRSLSSSVFHSLSLFLLHPFLPPLWLDPWLWLWAQQPCNPPLPCSKGLSSLRTGPLCEHSSGKNTALYVHVYVRACVRVE